MSADLNIGIPTSTLIEGEFMTEIDGKDAEVKYVGTLNRYGEFSTLTTWIDGERSPKHSEPDWLYEEMTERAQRLAGF